MWKTQIRFILAVVAILVLLCLYNLLGGGQSKQNLTSNSITAREERALQLKGKVVLVKEKIFQDTTLEGQENEGRILEVLKSGYWAKKPEEVNGFTPLQASNIGMNKKTYEYRIKHNVKLQAQDMPTCKRMEAQVSRLHSAIKTEYYTFGSEQTSIDQEDVTLVTQLSSNRVEMMLALMDHWKGPMSVAVYAKNSQDASVFMERVKQYGYNEVINLCIAYEMIPEAYETSLYPINFLRNIAVDNAATDFVFLCDGDFIPSYRLHEALVKSAKTLLMTSNSRRALVVAAFEEKRKMVEFPMTKYNLSKLYSEGNVTQFHDYFIGHRATNYTKWFQTSSAYGINWEKDYEPYVMVKKHGLPQYDESFIGYGFNKLVFIAELQAMKYEFIVIPDEFLIHRIHPTTNDKKLIDEKGHVRNCIKHKYMSFLWNYLPQKYGPGWEKFMRVYAR